MLLQQEVAGARGALMRCTEVLVADLCVRIRLIDRRILWANQFYRMVVVEMGADAKLCHTHCIFDVCCLTRLRHWDSPEINDFHFLMHNGCA